MSDSKSESNMKTSISHVPPNIILSIFGYLDVKSLCLASRVCRSWYSYANDPSLWKVLDLKPYQYTLRVMKKIINRRISENSRELHIRGHISATKKLVNISMPLLEEIKKKASHLSCLTLSNCYLEGIQITSFPRSIKTLCLGHSIVPLGWFEALKTKNIFPSIQELDLSFCSRISSEDVNSICQLPTLKTLTLTGCYRVTDNDIRSIATKLQNIVSFDISDCKRITDVSLHHIARHLKSLEKLHLRSCHLITPLGLASLKDGAVNMKLLDLTGCNEATQKEALVIFPNCKKLVIDRVDS